LDGIVTRYEWANPHVYVHLRTTNDSGENVVWRIEAQPLAGMARLGWSDDSVAPGDHVIVVANPPKDPHRTLALGRSLLKDDGTSLSIPQGTPENPPGAEVFAADGLSGQWVPSWSPDVALGFLRAGSSWPLTARGVEAMESYSAELNPGKDCVPEPIPYRMIWPLPITIAVGDEETRIRYEAGEERIVDMRTPPRESGTESVFGHSTGTWDDDALVVDTTHFAEHRRGNAVGGLASGTRKHLVERFELTASRTQLTYSFRLEDPEYLAEPVSGTLELDYRPDFEFLALPCDLEVARRYLEQ
jgi:hypothetical protein